MKVPAEKPDSSICIGCGLCCDGTLHGSTTVQRSDEETVRAAALEIVNEGQRSFFRQPCPHFSCGSCSIYANRPGVCRTYQCALLTNVDAGKIDMATARATIEKAKKLIAAVMVVDATAVTPAKRSALTKRLKAKIAQLHGRERELTAKSLLDVALLEHFLNRWFFKESPENPKGQKARDR